MSLTAARGPLGPNPAGKMIPPHSRRVQGVVDGRNVIDTERALLVHRAGHPLSYAFPDNEIGRLPSEPLSEVPGFVTVPWGAVDAWFEEGRQLVHYPPNPYHRVDCRSTSRRLRVEVAGTVLVDTRDTVILFETALAPKLYVSPALVGANLLRPSETASYCNYKGDATYWSAVIDDIVFEDVAWSYEDPLPESSSIKGFLSFDQTRAHVEAELPAGSEGALDQCDTECAVPSRQGATRC
jgi:uncharacterized protein (DUF427 family)